MSPSLLAHTPLADLADTRGWFAVATPVDTGGTLRSIVYVDGDVTTKLIGARTVGPRDLDAHFAAIDGQAARVRARLRAIVGTVVALWCLFAAAIVATERDAAGIAGAVAVLVPLAIVVVQRVLRRRLTTAAPWVVAIGAAATIVVAQVFDVRGVTLPAAYALVGNLALVVGLAYVRHRLRAVIGAG